jgi:hypothetical protein
MTARRPAVVAPPAVRVSIVDDDGQPLLYQVEEHHPGRQLHVVVENPTPQPILLLRPADARPSGANHHVELRFRPGVLDGRVLGDAEVVSHSRRGPAGWWLQTEQRSSGEVSFYLLHEGPLELPAGGRLHVSLARIKAMPESGSRGTRVLFQLRPRPEGESEAVRQEHLRIVKRRGKPSLPLHPGVRGSNVVLNDGHSLNRLWVQLTNLSAREPIPFDNLSIDVVPRLVLWFEAGHADNPLALSSPELLADVEIEVTRPGWSVRKDVQGVRPEWIVTAIGRQGIAPLGVLELEISNLITAFASGTSLLHIAWENIPGHWDGTVSLPIERAPLLFRDDCTADDTFATTGRVGIGTAAPRSGLEIVRESEQLSLTCTDDRRWGLSAETGTGRLRLQHTAPEGEPEDRLVLHADGTLGLYSDRQERLHLDQAGRVGIGTSTPSARLDVAGPDFQIAISHPDHPSLTWGITHWADSRLYLQTWSEGHHQRNVMALSGEGTVTVDSKLGISVSDPHLHLAIGDNDTGLNQQGDGELAIYTDSWERVRVDKSGRVGVGTTIPRAPLDVVGDDFQLAVTNRQGENWGLTNWTDGQLYFQYRRNGVFESNAMWLDKSGVLRVGALEIGGVRIGARELDVLKKLAAGQLVFELLNTYQNEYLYAADYAPYDDDRRRVFTWRTKGVRVTQGTWQMVHLR